MHLKLSQYACNLYILCTHNFNFKDALKHSPCSECPHPEVALENMKLFKQNCVTGNFCVSAIFVVTAIIFEVTQVILPPLLKCVVIDRFSRVVNLPLYWVQKIVYTTAFQPQGNGPFHVSLYFIWFLHSIKDELN